MVVHTLYAKLQNAQKTCRKTKTICKGYGISKCQSHRWDSRTIITAPEIKILVTAELKYSQADLSYPVQQCYKV